MSNNVIHKKRLCKKREEIVISRKFIRYKYSKGYNLIIIIFYKESALRYTTNPLKSQKKLPFKRTYFRN